MAFRHIVPPTGDELQDNLPWYNVWRRTAENPYEAYTVLFCQKFTTGIMVVCIHYKGYVHEGTRLHSHLLEALDVWADLGTATEVLKVVGDRKGKISVGVDDEELCHRWIRSEDRYAQIRKKSEAPEVEGMSSNPLLAGSGVRTTRTSAGTTSTEDQESHSKGSTKPRKAG